MRKLFSGLIALIILGSPAFAGEPCRTIKTPDAKAITWHTKGYLPVALYLHKKVPGGKAEEVARNAIYKFWIDGWDEHIIRDREYNIQKVERCDYYGRKLTLVTVRSMVMRDMTTATSYTLVAAIRLPTKVVRAGPKVGTTLRDKTKYVGKWGRTVINHRKVTTLDLE